MATSAIAATTTLLGKHVAEVALVHLGALIGGLRGLGCLVEVLLLTSEQTVRDLLHRGRQGLLLLQGDLTLIALPTLAWWLLIEKKTRFKLILNGCVLGLLVAC